METKNTFVAQEGGEHYLAEYQHWDWVVDIGMTYLPATATKYLTRWRKKNGLQDLMKAQTYLEKLVLTWDTVYYDTTIPSGDLDEKNVLFITKNDLVGTTEATICCILSDLSERHHIDKVHSALAMVKELIAEAHGSAG